MTQSRFDVRVYYEDTDLGGVVYYANYLKFAERARTEALRQAGIEQTDLLRDHNIAFVVRRCEVDFLKPAMMDDLLIIHTIVESISRVTILMRQEIFRGEEKLILLKVKLAVINGEKSLAKLPEFVHKALTSLSDKKDD